MRHGRLRINYSQLSVTRKKLPLIKQEAAILIIIYLFYQSKYFEFDFLNLPINISWFLIF